LSIFYPKKCYNPISLPLLSRFIPLRLFSVPQVENEVKRTPHCGCCWDSRTRTWRIKEGPKIWIFGSFIIKCTTAQKPVYMPMELILNKRRYVASSCVFDFKKISPKTFGPYCVFLILYFIWPMIPLSLVSWTYCFTQSGGKTPLQFHNGTENKFRVFRASLLRQKISDTLKVLFRTCPVDLLCVAAARYC